MSGQRVGVIGVGNMGGRISRRILDSGRALVGYDPAAEQLERFGVPGASSVPELVGGVDVILFSLPDSRVIERVVFEDDGVLGSCSTGQLVIDLSTAAPSSTVRIHAAFRERGVEFLDAGISGGAVAAEKGTLSIMVGGSEEALDRVRDLLGSFASNVYYMGPSGSGHTAKLLNNFLNGVSLAATAEVMVAAKKAGLDLATFLDAVNHSSGVNFATLNRFPSIIRGDYLEGGLTGKLMAKDVQLYVELLGELGVPSASAPGCLAAFGLAIALGYGDEISNRVVDALGDVAGGVRLHDSSQG
jgi:3-hydroxyisobutyrate dehydrogenase-like beta-hydroxyacid dehydrogenase